MCNVNGGQASGYFEKVNRQLLDSYYIFEHWETFHLPCIMIDRPSRETFRVAISRKFPRRVGYARDSRMLKSKYCSEVTSRS